LDGGSARRKAATYTQNKHTQTYMFRVGFESTIAEFERANTVHALDCAATVIGHDCEQRNINSLHVDGNEVLEIFLPG
jgi:hypothetical protein